MILCARLKVRSPLKACACLILTIVVVLVIRAHPCIHWIPLQISFPKYDGDLEIPPDITIVTAFFDLGRFQKGEGKYFYDSGFYSHWASVFKYLENPTVIYTDSKHFEKMFNSIRSKRSNTTKVIRVERKNLWAFNYEAKIRTIYANRNYPKFHPNTVLPEYSCVQHAKYSCMEKAITENYFKTTYFMWLDVGYFRSVDRNRNFRLELPSGFNSSRIAFNEVERRTNLDLTPHRIFKTNIFWVGGGCIIAKNKVFLEFIKDYRKALEHYLQMGLSNTDQQVIFSMYTDMEMEVDKPRVDIQTYSLHFWGQCWFFLGLQCYREIA